MQPAEAIRVSRLANDVRILTEEVPGMPSVSLGIWVENGSRNEPDDQAGISHFLEHLFFKGTERRTAREIAQAIEDVGGMLNAFTGKETTCYYVKVLGRHFGLATDLLGDVFLGSTFPPDEVERERDVIVQEILQYEDSPDEHVHDLFAKAFWGRHPLGRPIAGFLDTVRTLEPGDFHRFKSERYGADRVVVAAAGAVRHEDLVRAVGGSFEALGRPRELPDREPPAPYGGTTVVEKEIEQAHVCLGVPALPQTDPGRFAAQILNQALGGGMSSRLFQRIREERGRAYAVYSFLSSFSDCGYLGVYVATAPGWVAEVVELIDHELDGIRRDGIEADEITRAKNQLTGALLLGLESSEGRMSRLARGLLAFGRPITVDEVCREVEAVRPADVAAAAERLLGSGVRCLTVLGPVDRAALSGTTG